MEFKNLLNEWDYKSTNKSIGSGGMKLEFNIIENDDNSWTLRVLDKKGEVSSEYTGTFNKVIEKLNKYKVEKNKNNS